MKLYLTLLCLILLSGMAHAAHTPPRIGGSGGSADDIVPHDALVIGGVGRYGRTAVHTDAIEAKIVAGQWVTPKAGDTLALPGGALRKWEAIAVGADGMFHSQTLNSGYAFVPVHSDAERIMILEASGHSLVYVNGEPRVGDPYQNGIVRLPIRLRAGDNELLFNCGTGQLRVKLVATKTPAQFDARDSTLPDLLVDQNEKPREQAKVNHRLVLGPDLFVEKTWAALVVLNTTNAPLDHLYISAACAHARPILSPLPNIPAVANRKVGFRIPPVRGLAPGNTPFTVTLLRKESGHTETLDTTTINLRVRRPFESQKRTFISDIDGSVQYYALNPAHPLPAEKATSAKGKSQTQPMQVAPALFLSLHGAGVEAIGQADAYEAKTWGHIVAPTNRRPFGFDWEDWGQLDALEVLGLAQQQLHTDPHRTYLVGHSMGGHGTWHLSAIFPDRFAAIGPSAGWISFASYVGGPGFTNPTPIEEMLRRAASPSDTLTFLHNYAPLGVYILHGTADDNVPIAQAREMKQHLAEFHHDFVLYEQPGAGHWWDASDEPGADCVDWAPMFDFLARHDLPADEAVRQVDFTTVDPGISAWSNWACIEEQIHPLMPSAIHLRCDPGLRRFTGTTENVARLAIRLDRLPPDAPLRFDIDGQKIENVPWPANASEIWLAHNGTLWQVVSAQPPAWKSPLRSGPFKDAFRHRMVFVYGTLGTPQENAWAFAKARYDAETFWYRGNGSIDIVADSAFDPAADRDRSVILYGNADTNSAWKPLLAESPVQVKRGGVRIGDRTLFGDDIACLFLRPRPGSDRACVGVVSGTGLPGMRLSDRLPYFVSGVAYPDFTVIGTDALTKGVNGIRAVGFFGNDWSLSTGDLAFRDP